MSCEPPLPWGAVEQQLRPFIAQRVPTADVDDVLQDVFARMQRGLGSLRDDERFSGWLYQVARSAIAVGLPQPSPRSAPGGAAVSSSLE